MILRAAVVGEQQQAERDLGDDERLGEREQLRDERCPRAAPARQNAAAEASDADGDHEECIDVVGR